MPYPKKLNARLLLLIFMALGCYVAYLSTAKAQISEYTVKAKYIYNFIALTEWPKNSIAGKKVVFCTIGEDPFRGELEDALAKPAGGFSVDIRRNISLSDVNTCNALFISKSEPYGLGRILRKIGNSPTLTISEYDDFIDNGGMIGFVEKNNRVLFAVNIENYKKAGIKISSRVLELAVNLRR